MASEEQAVQLLNDAKLETDGNSKVDKLKGLYELVVNKQPALLEEFVPEVVELQVDPSPAVRKYLPEFLSGAAQALPTAGVLQQCIQCTAHLLSDEVAAAAKQAVLTSNLLFRTALSLVAAQGGDVQQAPALRALWEAAQGLKAAAVSMAAQHKNDGVRLNAAKFLEQAALLLTADSLPAVRGVFQGPIALQAGNQVVTKSVLVKDGEGLLTQLVALLKLRFGEDVSGPVAIVLVKGAGTVAQQRPQFLGKLLPALLALANSGKYKVDAAEGGMQSSIANALKQALVGVLRSTDPKAVIWRKKVVDAMGAMGAAALAEATLKQASRGNKRGGSEEPEASKRPRVAAAAAAQSQQQQQPAVQAQALPPQPQAAGQQAVQQPGQGLVAVPPSLQAAGWQQQQQQQVPQVVPTGTPPLRAAVGMGAEVALPPPTSQQDLDRVLTVLRALVAKGDANTLAAIVSGLQPAVLADVVLALAPTLPPRHVLPPDHLSLHPWVLQLLQLLAPQTQLMPLPAALPQQAPPFMQAIQPQPHQQAAFSGLQQAQPLQPQQQLPTLPAQPAQLQPLVQQPSGGMAGVAGQQASQLQPSVPAAPPSVQGAPPQAGQSLAASRPVLLDQQQQQPRQPTPPPPPPPRRQPLPQPQPQQSAAATAAARGPTPPPAAKPQPPRAAPAPAFRLAPLPLTAQQQADLRKAAVLRILSSRQVASPGLQRALVAKLAASAGDGEELGDAVLQFLLEDFAGRGGFELCMLWLDALFAAACKPLGAAGQAARPGPGQGAASLAEFVNSGLESFGLEEFLGIKSEQEQQQPGSNSSLDAAGTTGASGSGAGCGPSSNGGSSKYEVVLMALLEGLREALPPSDKTIVRLLLEVPSLPMPAVRQFLRELCGSGPDWATLALLAARDLIDQRPPSRQQMLAFVLESAGDANPDVRSKAVRLTANRLFPQPAITAAIERHARQQLDSMVVARRQLTSRPGSAGAPAPAQSSAAEPAALAAAADDVAEGKNPPEGAVAAAVDGTEAGAAVGRESQASEHAAAPDKEGDSDQQAAQAEGTRSGGPETFAGGEQPRPQEQQAVPSRGAGVAAADVSSSKATPPESEGGAPIAGAATGAAVGMGAGGAGPDEARAAQLCALYCALCTKKHSLLRHLFEVYGQTSDGGRAAIHKNAPGLAKTLGATAAALLAIVQDPPEGSLNLAINMLYVLTEATLPPPALVAAGRQLFERCRDARVLPPLVAGMDKAAVLRLLPALLDLAPEAGFKVAVQRLVTPQQRPAAAPGAAGSAAAAAEPPLFAPSELLAALHQLDHASSPGLLRKMMAGVTACLALRELFGREALAAAIGQMLTRAPLPHLFMRTVIQSLGAAPSLRPFVVSTLGQLVGRQIYNDAVQWRGWVMAAQQTAPDSFPAWLQLPPAVLGQALQGVPVAFRQQLAAFATSPKCTQSVPRLTLEVLQQHMLAPPEGQQQGSS